MSSQQFEAGLGPEATGSHPGAPSRGSVGAAGAALPGAGYGLRTAIPLGGNVSAKSNSRQTNPQPLYRGRLALPSASWRARPPRDRWAHCHHPGTRTTLRVSLREAASPACRACVGLQGNSCAEGRAREQRRACRGHWSSRPGGSGRTCTHAGRRHTKGRARGAGIRRPRGRDPGTPGRPGTTCCRSRPGQPAPPATMVRPALPAGVRRMVPPTEPAPQTPPRPSASGGRGTLRPRLQQHSQEAALSAGRGGLLLAPRRALLGAGPGAGARRGRGRPPPAPASLPASGARTPPRAAAAQGRGGARGRQAPPPL